MRPQPVHRRLSALTLVFTLAAVGLMGLGTRLSGAPIILHLRNGDQVSGELLSESGERVRLKHPLLGVIRIPTSEIVRRGPDQPPAIPPSPTPPAPPPAANPPVAAAPAAAKKPTVPAAAVPPPKPAPAPAPRRWTFDFQAGVDLGFGATDRQLYNGRAHAAYGRNRLRQTFDYLFTFGKTAGLKSADRMDGMFKTDYEIGRRFFLYNLGGVGYDNVRHIDERYEIGPGLGYHVLRQEKLKLNAELGGNYQVHQFADGTESQSFFYRIAEDSFWQITPKLSIDQKFEFFPGITDFKRYRMRFEGNLRYTLRGNIYLNVTALDIYDNQPAVGVSRNDLQLRSSVGVKF